MRFRGKGHSKGEHDAHYQAQDLSRGLGLTELDNIATNLGNTYRGLGILIGLFVPVYIFFPRFGWTESFPETAFLLLGGGTIFCGISMIKVQPIPGLFRT